MSLGKTTYIHPNVTPFITQANPTYQKIFNDTTLAGMLTPTIDQGLPDPITGKFKPLGNLSEGEGVPKSDSKLTPTVDGLEVEVSHTRPDAASANRGIASKTLYLVSLPKLYVPNDPPQPPIKLASAFNQAQNIVAVVHFDLPNSHAYMKPNQTSNNRWAVSVNVKNGDAQDLGPQVDHPIGPACVFLQGGWDALGGVIIGPQNPSSTQPPFPPANTKYNSFIGPPPTLFRLQIHINRTPNSATAYSTLTVGNYQPLSGPLSSPPDNLTTAALNPTSFSAIGLIVVNAGATNPDSTVRVRFKSLSIWIS